MDSRELFHLWANQSKPAAKSGNVFFEGDTCYSYGKHFPIAKLKTLDDGTPIVLFNPGKYSVSTTRHQSYARQSVHGREIHTLDTSYWYLQTREELEDALKQQEKFNNHLAEKAKEDKKQAAKAKRDRIKREKLARESYPALVDEWRKGGPLPRFSQEFPVSLRLIEDGKRIQTTRGAIIPTIAAVKAWPLIKKAQSDSSFDWGNYKGFEVKDNFLKVGCHNIPVSEIEFMAAELELI